ncbi:MAG: hypothetical protein SGJ27_21195 [Candidatus Melainabacteria bacterium]|nr:hypothetical protein [Candidatus Melainabacteria bacterium]
MALSKVGQITGGEIRCINHVQSSVMLELDSGETARLPFGKLKGDKQARFDQLREGMELRVLVVETRDGRFGGQPFHIVSEHLDEVIEVEDSGQAPCAQPDSTLVIAFPVGKRVKGAVAQKRCDSGDVIVMLNGHRARLPVTELNGINPNSLRPGVAVKAAVLRVDGTGIVLSRKAV